VVDHPTVLEIAKKLGKPPANVLTSWSVQRGVNVIPKSVTPERIISNLEVFELSPEDFETLNRLECHNRLNFLNEGAEDMFGDIGIDEARAKAQSSATKWLAENKQ